MRYRLCRVIAALLATACLCWSPLVTMVQANDVLVAASGSGAEESVWGLVEGSTDPEVLQRFVDLYPNGVHADDARSRIRELQQGAEPVPELPTLMAPASQPSAAETVPASSAALPDPQPSSSAELSQAQLPPVTGNPCGSAPGETVGPVATPGFGHLIGAPMVLGQPVVSATFAGTGRCIIAWSKDGTIKVWESASGQQVGIMQADPGVTDVQFSANNGRLISYSEKAAVLWNVQTGERVAVLGVTDSLQVYFTSSGERIRAQSAKGLVRLWDAASGQPIVTVDPGEKIQNSAFSNDGRYVLTAAENNGRIKLWDVASGALVRTLGKKSDYPAWAVFSGDSRWVIAQAFDRGDTIKIFDVETGEQYGETMKHPGGGGLFVTTTPNGARMLSQGWGGNTLKVWDVAGTEQVGKTIKPPGGIYFGQLSTDGSKVLAWTSNGNVRLWDADSGEQIGKTMKQGGTNPWAALNADATRIVTSSNNKQVKLWDAATGEQVGKAVKQADDITGEFNPEGTRFYAPSTAKKGRPIAILDATDATLIGTLPPDGVDYTGGTMNWQATMALTWTADGTLTLWDATGRP